MRTPRRKELDPLSSQAATQRRRLVGLRALHRERAVCATWAVYAQAAHCSRLTANQDLQAMAKAGLVYRLGSQRDIQWLLTAEGRALIGEGAAGLEGPEGEMLAVYLGGTVDSIEVQDAAGRTLGVVKLEDDL